MKVKKGGTRGATGYADAYDGRDVASTNDGHKAIIELFEVVGNWENPNTDEMKQLKETDIDGYKKAWRQACKRSFNSMLDMVEGALLNNLAELAKADKLDKAKKALIDGGIPAEQVEAFLKAQTQ